MSSDLVTLSLTHTHIRSVSQPPTFELFAVIVQSELKNYFRNFIYNIQISHFFPWFSDQPGNKSVKPEPRSRLARFILFRRQADRLILQEDISLSFVSEWQMTFVNRSPIHDCLSRVCECVCASVCSVQFSALITPPAFGISWLITCLVAGSDHNSSVKVPFFKFPARKTALSSGQPSPAQPALLMKTIKEGTSTMW